MAVEVDDERGEVVRGALVEGGADEGLGAKVGLGGRVAQDGGHARVREDVEDAVRRERERRLGRELVIQRRFNVGVPRARVPDTPPTLRDRCEG